MNYRDTFAKEGKRLHRQQYRLEMEANKLVYSERMLKLKRGEHSRPLAHLVYTILDGTEHFDRNFLGGTIAVPWNFMYLWENDNTIAYQSLQKLLSFQNLSSRSLNSIRLWKCWS